MTIMKRKICVVTGTRAEYGLLSNLMKEIANESSLQLNLIATCMHLSPEFGLTYQQIEADGFEIDAKIEMLLSSDTPVGIAKSMGLGMIGFADALQRLDPDILVILGDRFEMLAVAQTAMVARIPIAHIHGGETSEGAIDDSIRHAITKMAQWHFVAAEPYRKRVVQLGEAPERVFNFGAPGLDYLLHMDWLDRSALEHMLDIRLNSPLLLVTYHPETLNYKNPVDVMNELLYALEEQPDSTVIFTYPNADSGGRALIERINAWVSINSGRAKAFSSLGQQRYLSLMREADVVIGNSSSALIEAPALKKATINIGNRQKGRLKASSVIDSVGERREITEAIRFALSGQFLNALSRTKSLYGEGNVGFKIKEVLKCVELNVQKSFYNIEYGY